MVYIYSPLYNYVLRQHQKTLTDHLVNIVVLYFYPPRAHPWGYSTYLASIYLKKKKKNRPIGSAFICGCCVAPPPKKQKQLSQSLVGRLIIDSLTHLSSLATLVGSIGDMSTHDDILFLFYFYFLSRPSL